MRNGGVGGTPRAECDAGCLIDDFVGAICYRECNVGLLK